MTPEEFRAALKELGAKQVWFAHTTGMSPTTVSRWAKGLQPIPKWVTPLLDGWKIAYDISRLVIATEDAEAIRERLAAYDTPLADLPATHPRAGGTRRRSSDP